MSKSEPKKELNHVRILSHGIGTSVLVAFLVSAVNPIIGWVFGLITIVIVTLPMTLITVIVHNVQARRSTPESLVKAESVSAPEGEHASQVTEVPLRVLRAKQDFKNRGWIHLSLGIGILTLAIINLILLQSEDFWGRMFAEPFWWIIALCSSVSFILSSTNFAKAGDFIMRGWIDLIVGLSVLALATHNLILAQTNPMWTAPYWWIIASLSSIFFIFASTNFTKASKLKPKNQKGESKH